jgi:hypothetical protein
MLGKRFIFIYSLVWVITGILLIAADSIDWLKGSPVFRYLAIPAIVIAMAYYAVKQIPAINDVKAGRAKTAIIVIGSSLAYTLLRGMIPDGFLPDSILVELLLKYLYSLALLYIIVKSNVSEGAGVKGNE